MPSAFTTNLNLELVARGEQVGVWDTPENSNWGLVDAAVSGGVTIPLTNSPITLSQAQYKCNSITLTGALGANVAVTLPAISRDYIFHNLITNSTAFFVTLGTTVAGGRIVGIPPGRTTTIWTDGTNTNITNFGETIGAFHITTDLGASAEWHAASTIRSYLRCDGTTFSSAAYPTLTERLGGTTLPNISLPNSAVLVRSF